MAKPKGEPIFEEPEFDEREYLEGEKERAKTLIVTFVIGAFLGLFAGYIYVLGYGYMDILLVFVFLVFLRQILKTLNLTLPKRTWHWVLVGGEFLLTIIIFWTIFINPPITTVSNIQISELHYQNSSGQWVSPSVSSGNYIVGVPGTYSFEVYINYNSPITGASISPSPSLVNSSYSYSTHYMYFNATLTTGSIASIHITATSGNRTASADFNLATTTV